MSLLSEKKPIVHREGECECGRSAILLRSYFGYPICVCGRLLRRATRLRKERDSFVRIRLRRGNSRGYSEEEVAVAYLRAFLGAEGLKTARLMILYQRTEARWTKAHHFGFGREIRNLLRKAGFSESSFGVSNLDDVYLDLLVKAVGVRFEEEKKK